MLNWEYIEVWRFKMRKIIFITVLLFVLSIGTFLMVKNDHLFQDIYIQESREELPKLKTDQSAKELQPFLEGDLFELMGESSDRLIDTLGKPIRKDVTPYGYTWWIYTDEQTSYLQFGIANNEIQTIFATGDEISSEPFKIGTDYKELQKEFSFDSNVTYQSGVSFYSFLLNETDLKMNPLIKLSEDIFAQLYFDTFTSELSSIRILTGNILLKQRLYEMEYRGNLPEEESLSDEDWKKVDKGMEQQIVDLTNIYRHRHGLNSLAVDEQVSEVALIHSKDMYEENYFSHYSQDGSGLKERLEQKAVYYLSAGENIAAQHTDAPAAIEGWLNSEGHRETLLNETYTHLGVGVYRYYYTQNFLLKPSL